MKRGLFGALAIIMAMSFGACSKSGDKSTASTTPAEKSAKSNKEGEAQNATAEGEKSAKSNKDAAAGGEKSAKSNKEGDKGSSAAAAGSPDSAPKAP